MNRRTFFKGVGAAMLSVNLWLVPARWSTPTMELPPPWQQLFVERTVRECLRQAERMGIIHPGWEFRAGDMTVKATLGGTINHITITGKI